MINQLILAGSKYFNPNRLSADEADSEVLPSSPPRQTEEIIEKLLQGDMAVHHVPPDIYLHLLEAIREKIESNWIWNCICK